MSVCDPARFIGTYMTKPMIDPCNAAKAIGTYDPNFNGDHTFDGGSSGGCSCDSGGDCVDFCGKFTGTSAIVNPVSIFTTEFVTGLFELYLEDNTDKKGSYYSYFVNPLVTPNLNIVTAQGQLNNSTYTPAGDTSQIKFQTGVGIVLNFSRIYDCFWKFSCHTK